MWDPPVVDQELSVIVQRREENPHALYILFIYWVSSLVTLRNTAKLCVCRHDSPLALLTLSGKHTAAAKTQEDQSFDQLC